jgi:hypothetical protein
VHVEFPKAIVQKISHMFMFESWVTSLHERQIPLTPLLDQCHGNRATYADDHTAEPEDIDHDNKKCPTEWLVTHSYDAFDACLVRVDFLGK